MRRSGERDKTFCEFFAGIGLVHEALRRGDWRCTYANDIDAKKRDMYAGNYGVEAAAHYHLGDVWEVDEALARIPGRPFLATASFPCTDMSLAGKRRGLAGEQSGTLFAFLQVLERLAERRPLMVLLENVPGFLTSHGGQDFATAIAELASLDYWVDSFVIDAQWFVPQSRPRLFLIGYDRDLLAPPVIVRSPGDESLLAAESDWQRAMSRSRRIRPERLRAAIDAIQPTTGWATVDCGPPTPARRPLAELLDATSQAAWWDAAEVDRHYAMTSERHRRQIDLLRQRADLAILTAFRRVRQGQQRMEVRFDGVAGCLRTPRGGSAKQIVVAVGRGELRMRWMSPREYARLQGADDYILPANTIQALFGFGDAVCVPAIQWIDRHMLSPVWREHERRIRSSSATSNMPAAGVS